MLIGEERERFEPNALHMTDPVRREARALTSKAGERLRGTNYTTLYENGAAVLDIHGPVFRHADTMATSGAMSTESVFHELRVARSSQNVKSLIIHEDTPGGDATAGNEVAQFINDMSKEKPVECYIEGLGASLGYYWASACRRITMSRMALAGSIGVVIGIPIPDGKTKFGDNVLLDPDGSAYAEIVSSVSPLKRADATTKEGHKYFLNMVNQLADVFVSDVARFRGLDASRVPSQYGDGGVYVASQALSMGLCDEVGSFETVLQRMIDADWERGSSMTGASGVPPAEPDDPDGIPAPDINPADDLDPEAQDTGGDMSLKERMKAAVGMGDGGQKKTAKTTTEGDAALPIEDVLAHLEGMRPTIEAQVEPEAAIFGLEQVLGSKLWPNCQHQIAGLAMVFAADDKLYGGVVSYVNSKGDEVKGTRMEALEEFAASLNTHTMAEERVAGLRTGKTKGRVLGDIIETETVADEDEASHSAAEVTAEEAMQSSPQGRAAAANAKQGGANGNGARASGR